jgi:hypothetical protein
MPNIGEDADGRNYRTGLHFTHDYWVFGHWPSSGILKNTTYWKLDLFPSSGKVWETPTLLGLLERANLKHCNPVTITIQGVWLAVSNGPNRVGVSHFSVEDGNRSSFQNIVFFSVL